MSLANYIIICDMEIGILSAGSPGAKLVAASKGAKELVTHIESKHQLTQADTQAISDLQHEFMDNFTSWKKDEVDRKVNDMLDLLKELEEKFE